MRILVTGGAGYIGSQTARRLVAAGHEVTIVDDLGRGHRGAVGDLPLVVGDVRDRALVGSILAGRGIEAVIHFAALKSVEESVREPGLYFDDNVDPTQITLCPASCEAVQEGTENASVQVVLGCIEPPAD